MIEAIVGLAMLGILVVVMSQFLGNTNNTLKNTELESERLAAIASLRNKVSCSKTFVGAIATPRTNCSSDKYIDVRDANDNVLISASGSTVGVWSVRAQCTSTGLEIRSARLTPSATSTNWDFASVTPAAAFYKDPLSRQLMHWTWDAAGANKRHILINKGELCPEYFFTSPGGGGAGSCTSQQYFGCVNEPKFKVVTGNMRFSTTSCTEGIKPALLNVSLKGVVANGTVNCPTGWRATGGGGNCSFTARRYYGGAGVLPLDIQGGGLFRHLSTTNDFLGGSIATASLYSGYTISCCSYVYVGKFTYNVWPPEGAGAVWATCVPES